jgi:hypothetical protein
MECCFYRILDQEGWQVFTAAARVNFCHDAGEGCVLSVLWTVCCYARVSVVQLWIIYQAIFPNLYTCRFMEETYL